MAEDFLPVTYEKVNSFLRRKAESELNEDESRTEAEIRQMKEMVHQTKVPTMTNDEFLMWFLRSKKHNLRRAFEQLQNYSYQRHNLMKYYGFIDFEKIRVPIESGVVGVLPRRDSQGRAIIFMRACVWHSDLCPADDVLKALQALIHFCLAYPATQISGYSFVFDNYLSSLDTLHLFIKYATTYAPTITAFPGRFQRIVVVNANLILRSFVPILLSLAPFKLKNRASIHGNAKKALPKIFDPSILPEEFGGTMGPINTLHFSWITHLQHFVPKLHATNKYFKRETTVDFPENGDTSWDVPCN